jgi:beta-N-acetylhexosaminidase
MSMGVAVTNPSDAGGDLPAALLRAAAARPLAVAECDAALHPWQARLRDALLSARPDAVRVFTGLPEPGATGHEVLCTYGRGRTKLRPAAEVLTGFGARV